MYRENFSQNPDRQQRSQKRIQIGYVIGDKDHRSLVIMDSNRVSYDPWLIQQPKHWSQYQNDEQLYAQYDWLLNPQE